MNDWKRAIGHCFGLNDRAFAEHPSDLNDAFDLLTQLRDQRVLWFEFEPELRLHLKRMPKLDTEQQVRRVRTFIEPWLY